MKIFMYIKNILMQDDLDDLKEVIRSFKKDIPIILIGVIENFLKLLIKFGWKISFLKDTEGITECLIDILN